MSQARAGSTIVFLAVLGVLMVGATAFVAFRYYLPATRKTEAPLWPVAVWALGALGVIDTIVEVVRVHGRFPFVLAAIAGVLFLLGVRAMGLNYRKWVRGL